MISERLKKVAPSITLAIDAKAKQMKKDGIDLVGFGAGEPDFNTPENIKEAGIKAIKDNQTRYTPASGMIELKTAVVEKFKKDNNLDYKPSDIIISCGAKHSLFNIFMAVLNPGDEVIIFSPYWVSYEEQVKIADGIPVFVELDESKNFEIDFDLLNKKITKKTKVMIINSPSNPTGTIFSEKTLQKLAEIALKNNILIVSDEIYEKLIYNGKKHISIASLSKEVKAKTVVVNGVSKTYAMTGWRIGYIAADDKEIISVIDNLQSHSTSNPTTLAQIAAIEALKTPESVIQAMVDEFDKRRKHILKRVRDINGLTAVEPEGAFYIFPNFSYFIGKTIKGKTINGSLDLAEVLLNEAKVAVVPGIAFGTDKHFRLSYATSMANIDKGLDRIAEILR
ncbi:MAG: pyridoxal phosphate-dependent aminotransferase [Candidatus Goldbacteria bacterium]|nr:pyridoxal phosphate-dependent aminotransferase [Candidatus Goldiibacteriota bacterium]